MMLISCSIPYLILRKSRRIIFLSFLVLTMTISEYPIHFRGRIKLIYNYTSMLEADCTKILDKLEYVEQAVKSQPLGVHTGSDV